MPKNSGTSEKIVHRILADGTVKEYRYPRNQAEVARLRDDGANALHKIGLAYVASPEFNRLSIGYQKTTRRFVSIIESDLGYLTTDMLNQRSTRQKFYVLRDKFAATPRTADAIMSTLNILLNFAYDRGTIDANHGHRIPYLYKNGARKDCLWTPEQETAILKAADDGFRRLYLGARYTLARKMDLSRLKWKMIDKDGWLCFQPSKTMKTTKVWVAIPTFAFPPLEELLKECRQGNDSEYIFLTQTGRVWTHSNVSERLWTAMERADIDPETVNLHFHDLRGTSYTELAEAGCTDVERNSVSGHALSGGHNSAGNYLAVTKPPALHAYTKWWAYKNPNHTAKVVELMAKAR